MTNMSSIVVIVGWICKSLLACASALIYIYNNHIIINIELGGLEVEHNYEIGAIIIVWVQ